MPDWIGLYLEEDLGPDGRDATSAALEADVPGRARVVARERTFACGLDHACEVFRRLGCQATPAVSQGWVEAGSVLLDVEGPARGILAAERTALNILARMAGIAAATRRIADTLTGCRVAGTRKTTPGFRVFEKEAIRAGGGDPHRMGLYDAAMVKDNHRAAGVDGAVDAIRRAHPGMEITIEAESLEDAMGAAQAGADWVLIDNQPPGTGAEWARRLRAAHPGIRIEASGGIRADDVAAYAWADRVSLGALTQRAHAADLSLEWVP